jgi:hypothetical protein
MLLMNYDDKTDQAIGDVESENTRESTISSGIEDDDFDHQQDVIHLDQASQAKVLHTTTVPLPKNRSRADTVFAHSPLPNS